MKYKKIILIIIFLAGQSWVKAQDRLITLSGVVVCEDSVNGIIPDVNIYNKNKKWGIASDDEGRFSIKMGINDTIIFSTIQHYEQIYCYNPKESFSDKTVEISMKWDTTFLDVVSIIGLPNFEAFKSELLQLKTPDNDILLVLPVIDKYAKENSSGEGAVRITGPLTYLSKKILLIGNRKTD